ncbi:Uncharacterised protein [Mycobacteroides abscessus subsp. abscessus]|nr:Uncharacterised protein [Mycobacteroides abscessus subsp. abscessus]
MMNMAGIKMVFLTLKVVAMQKLSTYLKKKNLKFIMPFNMVLFLKIQLLMNVAMLILMIIRTQKTHVLLIQFIISIISYYLLKLHTLIQLSS